MLKKVTGIVLLTLSIYLFFQETLLIASVVFTAGALFLGSALHGNAADPYHFNDNDFGNDSTV